MNATFLERRATLFVSDQIRITEENIPTFITMFGKMGLYPSVNKGIGIKLTPKGVEQEDVISLDMKYLDETLKVSIGPDRIDIVSKKIDENWESFREFIANVSNEFKNNFDNDIIRYALCASVRLKLDQTHAQEAYGKLFKSNDTDPIEWQLRKVIRTKLNEPNYKGEVVVNNVYNISRHNAIVNGENISNIISIDMDINTLVGSDISALKHLQDVFWTSSADTIDSTVKNYYSIFLNER